MTLNVDLSKKPFSFYDTESEALQTIMTLDLEMIKFKLMDEDEGKGYNQEQVNELEKWYKRYLFLIVKYPSKSIVPSSFIDEMWHYHILDTRKYARDCENVLGYFLHHFPYFGMRGEEDAQNLKNSFADTKELFISEFGESLDMLTIYMRGNETSSGLCGSSSCGANDDSACRRDD